MYIYKKSLIRTFHTNFLTTNILYEITTREHKFKGGDFILKTGFKHCFKDFWYTEINLTQIWYDEFN